MKPHYSSRKQAYMVVKSRANDEYGDKCEEHISYIQILLVGMLDGETRVRRAEPAMVIEEEG